MPERPSLPARSRRFSSGLVRLRGVVEFPDNLTLAVAIVLTLQPVISGCERDVGFYEIRRFAHQRFQLFAGFLGLVLGKVDGGNLKPCAGIARAQAQSTLQVFARLFIGLVLAEQTRELKRGIEVVRIQLERPAELARGGRR